MTYSPAAIANFFIDKSLETGIDLSSMKLMKLVYLAHGWNLAIFSESLLNEAIQAWRYGPVIESLYQQFKHCGNEQIREFAKSIDRQEVLPHVPHTDQVTSALLDKIWQSYGWQSGIQLSNLTHEAGSPWHKAWNEQGGKDIKNYSISNDLIKQHYQDLIGEES